MSREQWYKSCVKGATNLREFKAAARHVPLGLKTNDPDALHYDEASEIFLSGLKLARQGDYEAGRAQIATAYLLDGRSVNWSPGRLPEGDSEAAELLLDGDLTLALIQDDQNSFASMVLCIMMDHHVAGLSQQDGQEAIADAMNHIGNLLTFLEKRPHLETQPPGLLGGCLTRPKLLFLRSSFFMSLGNTRKAIKDLTKALSIDPSYTPARDARACLWASRELEDRATMHAEFKRLVEERHPDNRGNVTSYAWLAVYTLEDPRLGTTNQAKDYYEKALSSKRRQDELYPRDANRPLPALEVAKSKFDAFLSDPAKQAVRRQLDTVHFPEQKESEADECYDEQILHSCPRCGVSGTKPGVKLRQCARCHKVAYCGRDCQTEDWKSHKKFCKLSSKKGKKKAAKASKDTSVSTNQAKKEPSVPKEPISELNKTARAAARIQDELSRVYKDYGANFAEWWHGMGKSERMQLLSEMTDGTLPREPLDPQATRALLESGQLGGGSLFEYSLESLAGPCRCVKDSTSGDCEHYHPDRLLHEMYMRAVKPDVAEAFDYEIIRTMMTSGVFPDLYKGELAFRRPAEKDAEGPEKYDIDLCVCTDAIQESDKQKIQEGIAQGVFVEGSVALYMNARKVFSLGLLIQLFDEYQTTVRRMPSRNPYARLFGCDFCGRSCESDEASVCLTCSITWWCCQGCKNASSHGSKCPHGTICESRSRFVL